MKNQALFSSKDKIKMSSAAIFVWPIRGHCTKNSKILSD